MLSCSRNHRLACLLLCVLIDGVLGGFKRFDITPEDITRALENAAPQTEEVVLELILNVRTFLGVLVSSDMQFTLSNRTAALPNVAPLMAYVTVNPATQVPDILCHPTAIIPKRLFPVEEQEIFDFLYRDMKQMHIVNVRSRSFLFSARPRSNCSC